MTRSDVQGWPELATHDNDIIRKWQEQGFGLTSVARQDGAFLIDVDDLTACVERGFDTDWLKEDFVIARCAFDLPRHGA
jgi:hypothetical protein